MYKHTFMFIRGEDNKSLKDFQAFTTDPNITIERDENMPTHRIIIITTKSLFISFKSRTKYRANLVGNDVVSDMKVQYASVALKQAVDDIRSLSEGE